MEIQINSWGFTFETGVLDIYFQRSGIISLAVIILAVVARRMYVTRKRSKASALKRKRGE